MIKTQHIYVCMENFRPILTVWRTNVIWNLELGQGEAKNFLFFDKLLFVFAFQFLSSKLSLMLRRCLRHKRGACEVIADVGVST